MNEQELESVIRRVLEGLSGENATWSTAEHDAEHDAEHGAEHGAERHDGERSTAEREALPAAPADMAKHEPSDGDIPDITCADLRKTYLVSAPQDEPGFMRMKLRTPARVGVGRAGARHRTETVLRFQADHAAAQDAVFSDVPEAFLASLSLPSYQTTCQSRDEFLTRPDKGRVFSPATLETIRRSVPADIKVLLYMSDGLSSSAARANAADILPVIREGLRGYGVACNEPFFVKYGRVGTMDALGDVIPAEVVCVLIGERPGLVTADSMSAYIAYRPRSGMPESRRTVLANIHAGGTPSVEAGAHIVDLIRLMLEKRVSGVELPV